MYIQYNLYNLEAEIAKCGNSIITPHFLTGSASSIPQSSFESSENKKSAFHALFTDFSYST